MDKILEKWKVIKDFPMYSVSNFGNVKNNISGNIRKNVVNKDGYLKITLYNKKYSKTYLIHRLVAEYFVDNNNKEKYNIINHKDENKENNIYTNLEWCDNKYNSNYGTIKERTSKRQSGTKNSFYNKKHTKESKDKMSLSSKNKKLVCQIDVDTNEIIKIWDSISDFAKVNNIKYFSSISACCKGKRNSAFGYKWKYV